MLQSSKDQTLDHKPAQSDRDARHDADEQIGADRDVAPERSHESERQIGTDHEEAAMGEIQDAENAEDERQTGGEQKDHHRRKEPIEDGAEG